MFDGEHFAVITCIIILCTAVDHPTGLIAERLQEDSGSFRVLWTPPAISASLIGYRIYYSTSGANDSGRVDVNALATNITISSRIPGVTYNITMVALSPHLPSPVIGPTTVTPGESFVTNSENSDCDGSGYVVTYDAFQKYNNTIMYPNHFLRIETWL